VAQHVGVHPRQPDTRVSSEALQPAGGGVPVHSYAPQVAQDRPVSASADGAFDGALHRGRQRDEHDLAALAPHPQHAVAVLLPEVGDVRPAGLEDPQPEQAEHGDQGEVVEVRRRARCAQQGLEL